MTFLKGRSTHANPLGKTLQWCSLLRLYSLNVIPWLGLPPTPFPGSSHIRPPRPSTPAPQSQASMCPLAPFVYAGCRLCLECPFLFTFFSATPNVSHLKHFLPPRFFPRQRARSSFLLSSRSAIFLPPAENVPHRCPLMNQSAPRTLSAQRAEASLPLGLSPGQECKSVCYWND